MVIWTQVQGMHPEKAITILANKQILFLRGLRQILHLYKALRTIIVTQTKNIGSICTSVRLCFHNDTFYGHTHNLKYIDLNDLTNNITSFIKVKFVDQINIYCTVQDFYMVFFQIRDIYLKNCLTTNGCSTK